MTAARRLLGLAGAVLAALGLGFAWFVGQSVAPPAAPPAHADGIVALTGGAERVGYALQLLAEGRAKRLLVSGVAPHSDLEELAASAGTEPPPAAEVTLGRSATTTLGNAAETAAWAGRLGLHSLIVVTASYHMPRAIALLRRALPGVRLYAAPVRPPALSPPPRLAVLRLLLGEYAKWLVAAAGLTRAADAVRAL